MNESRIKKERIINILILILFATIPLLFYSDIIGNEMLLVSGDGASYFSLRTFFNNAIWTGEFPYWNRYLEGGVPYGAYDSVGLYPVGLILSFLSPANFSYMFYFIHLIIGAYFTYLFLQEIGCSRFASLIVSLIYETSIHINGLRKSHIMLIAGIVYLPVILYFIQKYLNTGKFKFLICSSVVMGIQFLGAHTQIVLYTDVACFFYLLIFYIKNKEKIRTVISHYTAWIMTYFGVIFAQLYATLLLFMGMNHIGTEKYSFFEFTSYSIHFVKLLEMAFPYLFGDNVHQALGIGYSSEMDVEIFLGVFVLICLIFCGTHLLKKFEIKLSLSFMAIAFIYSALAHIPVLAKIIYMLPIFNGVKVPSRALFIFIFFAFVCLAVFITEIQDKVTMEKFLTFGKKSSAIGLGSIIIIGIAAIGFASSNDEIIFNLKKITKIFLPAAIVCTVILAVVLVYSYVPAVKSNFKRFYSIFCVFLLSTTFIETFPYSRQTSSVSDQYFIQKDSEIIAEISASDYKAIDAVEGPVDHASVISNNAAIDNKVMEINSYLTYNNPRLYRMLSGKNSMPLNYSGLFSRFENMQEILSQKNDLLSVLGVKYIFDTSNILAKNPCYYSQINDPELIYLDENDPQLLQASSQNIYYSAPIELNPYSVYRIEFDLDYTKLPEAMYIDAITETGYDGFNKVISPDSSGTHFSGYYSTGAADFSTSYIRVVMANTADVTIKNLAVYKCTATEPKDLMEVYSNEGVFLPLCDRTSYSLISDKINLKPNTDYVVSFDSYTDASAWCAYIDFYADGFDDDAQKIYMTLIPGEVQNHKYILNSGNCPNNLEVRFVSCSESNINITNFSVQEITGPDIGMYMPYYSGEEGEIYLNPNAKSIMFTVDNLQSVDENENIFRNIEEYDLLNTAYVQDYGDNRNLTGINTQITDISYTNNTVTATVNTDNDTFVNFSQCYYPGWKAYVDGKETPVYIVDDVIMGADVPAGQHTIKFKYAIPYFPLAVTISVGVVVFWIIYFAVKERSARKNLNSSANSKKGSE